MAYSNSPSLQTYETKRVSFIQPLLQRSGLTPTKDARLVNIMTEKIDNPLEEHRKYYLRTRPGLTLSYTLDAVNMRTPRGIYVWVYYGNSYVFSVVGNQVYVNGVLRDTLSTSTGQVGFTEFVSSLGIVTLVMVDGTNGYVYSLPSSTATQIVSANFPTPHIPMPVFMDGYLFLGKKNSEDVYNSVLDDPTLWNAGEYLSAEMYPDTLVGLAKNNNYIYAVGAGSIEYFYDVANATGTPLARHTSAVQQFGTPAPMTIVNTEKEVVLVGQTQNGGYTVWSIDGFKEKEIGIPAVKSALQEEGAAIANAAAFCIRAAGQKLYVIRLSVRTFVYSFDTEMWHEWASSSDNSIPFIATFADDGPNGQAYCLDNNGQYVYQFTEDSYTDAGTQFRCEIVTPKQDFDTINRKFMSRFSLLGNVPTTSGTGNTFQISWSDNDYQTWATDRTLSFDNDFPVITQLGNFRRRAFRIRYSQPYMVRLEGFEVDINKGNQ